MKISDGEKLILLMLSDLYQSLGVEGEIDHEFVRSAIFSNHLWGLSWKYSGIPVEKEETPEPVKDVADILDMWSFIEYSYKSLSDDDKATLAAKVDHFGKNPMFRGFDGNNESDYYSVAHFLINDLERFEEFKDRGLNSHMPTLQSHKRMLNVFLPMRTKLEDTKLSIEQLSEILQAQRHPKEL